MEAVIDSWFSDALLIRHNPLLDLLCTVWLVKFVCRRFLSWWFQDFCLHLHAVSSVLHQEVVWLWQFSGFWRNPLLRSISATAGNFHEFFDLRLHCSVYMAYLSSVALHHKLGPNFSVLNSSDLSWRLVVLIFVHLLWFRSWNTTYCFSQSLWNLWQ